MGLGDEQQGEDESGERAEAWGIVPSGRSRRDEHARIIASGAGKASEKRCEEGWTPLPVQRGALALRGPQRVGDPRQPTRNGR